MMGETVLSVFPLIFEFLVNANSGTTFYFLLPSSYFHLPTSYFLLPTSYFHLPTSYFLLPTSYFLLSHFQFSTHQHGWEQALQLSIISPQPKDQFSIHTKSTLILYKLSCPPIQGLSKKRSSEIGTDFHLIT